MFSRIRRVRRRSRFSLTFQKKKRTLDRRSRKSVNESLRSTSSAAGLAGCDLDDWLQAERELQEKYKNNEKGTKEN
jgi:hypothetical protein